MAIEYKDEKIIGKAFLTKNAAQLRRKKGLC